MAVDSSAALPASHRRWPAEWEPQQSVLLAWPTSRGTWPGRYRHMLPEYAALVRTVVRYLPTILLAPADQHHGIRRLCGTHSNLELIDLPTDDAWIRDYGPLGVFTEKGVRLVNFRFNAWGGKYPPWNRDDEAASHLAQHLGFDEDRVETVVEGGALETDGNGLVLGTRRSLIDPKRNAQLSESQLRGILNRFLGTTELVLLSHGALAGDDTDGHIDQLARFVHSRAMVVAEASDATDANHAELVRMQRELRTYFDTTGRAVELIRLPIPRDVTCSGRRLPASYCNFLMVPGAVLVPTFLDRHDDQAVQVLRELIPDRDVVAVRCRELVWGLGAVHCLTQTVPALPGVAPDGS